LEAITITLDGVEVSGHRGMTILDLARESGVNIPTLCHDDHLTSTGACRLCLVEDDTSGKLMASCVTPISPGMVINTHSPRVIERRKTILQLLLASHPDSCMVCDKGNRCQLRKLAAEMGIGLVRFHKIPQSGTIEEVNPFIERDLSKCIMCARCIRADQELVVEGAIDYFTRGFSSKPATLNDTPLEKSECTFCGTCVSMCPTGALMEKQRTYRGTTNTSIETVCPFCGCGCSICLETRDNRVVRVRPGTADAVNHATLCVKGCYGYDFIHSPERLGSPQVRTEDGFEVVPWEQAIDRVAAEFKRIKEEYGPDSLAVFGSSKCTNEENYLLQRFARVVLSTNNIDNGSRLYNPASTVGLGWSLGVPGTTSTLDDLEHSEVIMVIGADPETSAPAVSYAIKRAVRNNSARLLLVDPRQTKLASFAHLWLRPLLGTDVALISGLTKVIVEEKLIDEEFVARRTDNFTELVRSLETINLERIEEQTGVPVADLQRAARLFADAEKASIVYGTGITQQVSGIDAVLALANIAMLTGNIGRQGGGIFALQRENNAQGACDMGSLPDSLPGYHSVEDIQGRKIFEERWKVSLPDKAGLTALEMMQQAAAGKIKGMLIVGENPVSGFPSPSLVEKALGSLEFLVVVDMFTTETAKLATVILPAASFAEKEGTFTNFEGRIQPIHKAIDPVGTSLPDWQIVLRLAEAMGQPMPYSSPRQVMNEIEELVSFYHQITPHTGPDKEDLDWAEHDSSSPERKRLYNGLFPSGFWRFSTVEYNPRANNSGNGYPLTLIAGSILPHLGSGTRSQQASRLKKFSPHSWVETSEADARGYGLQDGDAVRVVSPACEVATTIRITHTLPPATLFMPISFPESPVNALFDVVLDARTKAPSFKTCVVRLERTSEDD